MMTTIQKWGNSWAVRLPKKAVEELELSSNRDVQISFTKKTISIKPSITKRKQKKYTLDGLLKGMTKEHLHPTIDWGAPRGTEIW